MHLCLPLFVKGKPGCIFYYIAPMPRVLIQFAHPNLEISRIHKQLLRQLQTIQGITLNDLYEHYPDFDIDVKREKQLLLDHDLIIFQHPFYWYSTPAVVKQWFDLVLEHGWAYGSAGKALQGKALMQIVSCGGSAEAYTATGRNRFTIRQLLAPVEQTALLCNMTYLPPYVIYGTHRLDRQAITGAGLLYVSFLHRLCSAEVLDYEQFKELQHMNEWLNLETT